MGKTFERKIALDIRDSEPDWAPFLPPKAPEGAPNASTGLGASARDVSLTGSSRAFRRLGAGELRTVGESLTARPCPAPRRH